MAANNSDMIVKVFSVEALDPTCPLEQVLEAIAARDLDRRNQTLANGARVRVEDIHAPEGGRNFWLLDFVRLRYDHGPGRASEKRAIQGFDMSNGDGFAEETAMLYVPADGLLLAQYNHFGIKDAAAAKYFASFGPDNQAVGFEFRPKLDDDVEAKLARADQFTTVRVKLAPSEISPEHRANNVPLERALEIADGLHGPLVEVTISVGHTRKNLSSRAVKSLVRSLQRMIGRDPGAVQKAQITGRDSSDEFSINEVLDMLTPHKRYSLAVEKDQKDLRFIRRSRYQALEKAYAAWQRG